MKTLSFLKMGSLHSLVMWNESERHSDYTTWYAGLWNFSNASPSTVSPPPVSVACAAQSCSRDTSVPSMRCTRCGSRQVIITADSCCSIVCCYRCYHTETYRNPHCASQLNGSNGEYTNADDVNKNDENKRVRREADTRRFAAIADGKHRKPTPRSSPDIPLPLSAIPTPVVKKELVRDAYTPLLKSCKVYLELPRHRELIAPYEYYLLALSFFAMLVYVSASLTPDIDSIMSGYLFLQMSTIRAFANVMCYAYLVLIAAWCVSKVHTRVLTWFLPRRIDTFQSVSGDVFTTPLDSLILPSTRIHHTERAFNCVNEQVYCEKLYGVLLAKHPMCAPREHTMQQLAATLTTFLGPEDCSIHQELLVSTTEYYFQQMIRSENRRRLIGAKRVFPTA